MGPLPPFERRPEDENENLEKLMWPWEKAPENKETKKKLDTKEEKSKKKPEQPKQEKEEKKETPKKEEKTEKASEEEEKRERRATLVEQSIALATKYEEEPIPRDASTIAQLMIAHQVLHLHNQLKHPDGDNTPEEIEATLNYITQLDEKFKNPDTKAEPVIEQSYQEIMKLAEATLEEESDLRRIVDEMSKTPSSYEATSGESSAHLSTEGMSPSRASRAPWADSHPPIKRSEGGDGGRTANKNGDRGRDGEQDGTANKTAVQEQKDPTQDEFDRRRQATKETVPAVATVSALIYLITHLGRNKPKKEIQPANLGATSDHSTSPAQQSTPPPSRLPAPHHKQAETSPSSTALSHPEYTAPLPSRERVSILPRRPSPALATAAVTTTLATTHVNRATSRPAPAPTGTQRTIESTKLTPEASHPSSNEIVENTVDASQRKIEHIPLQQLLVMAESVDIGHGRYLRREFEAGHIDREGLVKILKSHSKGRDYQFEFRRQASRFARLKQTSPEFLRQTKPAKTILTDDTTEEVQIKSTQQQSETNKKDTPATIRPLSLAPPKEHDLLPEIASSIHQPAHTGRRLALITIATLVGLAIIGWLAVNIFTELS